MIEESEFVILKSSEVRTKAVSAGRELEPSGRISLRCLTLDSGLPSIFERSLNLTDAGSKTLCRALVLKSRWRGRLAF